MQILGKIHTIRNTGQGSDYLGPCEVCKKHADTIHKLQNNFVVRKNDSINFLIANGEGLYGHENCVRKYGDKIFNLEDFNRRNNLRIVSKTQTEQIFGE